MGRQWLAYPREWLASFGEIVRFCSTVVAEVFSLKVMRFFGEALRQAGLLILSSTRSRCSASTRSRTSSCRASWR